MKRHVPICIIALCLAGPAAAQTVYKCPQPEGPPKYSQTPCETGGDAVNLNVSRPTGDGLRESERAYLNQRDQYWTEKARADDEERKRQEALRVEKEKAKAAYEQAEAQRATAAAIWATGRRW